MKILVTGCNGQLGFDVANRLETLGHTVLAPKRDVLDITDKNAVCAYFNSEKPEAVIHCAAYTAVDKAENDWNACYAVNVAGTRFLAECAEKCGAKLIYISSDYVFGGDGTSPYEVDDKKCPVNRYGESKLLGEKEALSRCSKTFVVRTSWVFGTNGRNFVKSMLFLGARKDSLRVVDDQIGSPTYTADLAVLLCDMIATQRYGIYHATNEGFCSWAQFAAAITKGAGLACTVTPIPSSEYPCDAARPLNSRLSKASLDKAGFARLPSWQDALARYLPLCKE